MMCRKWIEYNTNSIGSVWLKCNAASWQANVLKSCWPRPSAAFVHGTCSVEFCRICRFLWDVQHLSTHWPFCQNIVSDTRWRVMVWQQWIPCVQYVQGVQCCTLCMRRRYPLHWPAQQGTTDNAKPCTVLTHTSNSDTSQIFSLSLTSKCTKMCLKSMAICRARAHWTPDVKNMSRWQDL